MRTFLLPIAGLLALCSTASPAQVSLHIDIGLPPAPPLVQVQPGIQVVEGFGDEVFFSAGWYWCRRPNGWYRAASPRARFDWVDRRFVPAGLARIPPGRYRNWHHDGGPGRPGRFRPEDHRGGHPGHPGHPGAPGEWRP